MAELPEDVDNIAEEYGLAGVSVRVHPSQGDSFTGTVKAAYQPHPDFDTVRVLIEKHDGGVIDIAHERVEVD